MDKAASRIRLHFVATKVAFFHDFTPFYPFLPHFLRLFTLFYGCVFFALMLFYTKFVACRK